MKNGYIGLITTLEKRCPLKSKEWLEMDGLIYIYIYMLYESRPSPCLGA